MEDAYVRFVHALADRLPHLAELCGGQWPTVAARLDPVLDHLRNESDPARILSLINRVFRSFSGTPAEAEVRELFAKCLREAVPAGQSGQEKLRRDKRTEESATDVEVSVWERLRQAASTIFTTSWSSRPDFLPPPASLPQPQDESTLFYLMEGVGVEGTSIPVGCSASLVLCDGMPGSDAVAVVTNATLTLARKLDVEISLLVSTNGNLQLESSPSATATFKNGRLTAPVRFQMKAGEVIGPAVVHVDYYVKGALVHQSEITLEVVPALAGLPKEKAERSTLTGLPSAFLETASQPIAIPYQRIRLSLTYLNAQLSVHLTEFLEGQANYEQVFMSCLAPSQLNTVLNAVRKDLGPMYRFEKVWQDFDGKDAAGRDADEIEAALAYALEAVAVAGSRLYRTLRDDVGLHEVLDYVEQHGQPGCVLSVTTDSVFLPWEILNPVHRRPNSNQKERDEQPVRRDMFWGARFAIETDQRGDTPYVQRQKEHVQNGPKISVNLNPEIGIDGPTDRQPAVVHKKWAEALRNSGWLDGFHEACPDICGTLLGPTQASLIYVYCHGTPANPEQGSEALLRFAGACQVQPSDLVDCPQFVGAPIIFINSCEGGVSSPLMFEQFLRQFRRRGALGMIATTYQVPISFGASYASELINVYLRRTGSLSQEMLRLRRTYLDRMNPVPLLYSLQCHLDIPFMPTMEQPHVQ